MVHTQTNRPLAQHVAWVTGGGRGIGRAIAHLLARDGASVVVSARSADDVQLVAREIEDAGGQAIGVSCDVSDGAQVQAAFAAASSAFQRIDILVNNAGFVESAPLVRLGAALWDKTTLFRS